MMAVGSRRPLVGAGLVALAVLGSGATIAFLLESLLEWLLGGVASHGLRIAVVFVGYDLAIGLVLLPAIAVRLACDRRLVARPAEVTPVSILVAAYQEEACIVDTVARAAASLERGHEGVEIVVGDDGSTDGTLRALGKAFSLGEPGERGARRGVVITPSGARVPLVVLSLPHRGKGATLNALAAVARHPVLVTLDADTWPEAGAIDGLAAAFVDPRVGMAAGVVMVKNGRSNWLTRHQSAEYLKNALVRIGWASLGGLDQVPGAFSGIRAELLRSAGGFPTDSLTEDYEVTFRVMRAGAASVRQGGVLPLVVCVTEARVWTDGPTTFSGFVRQRTRWFAGFLSTLYRFRGLLFEPGTGTFGFVRLPLKVLDAVLPLLAFASLAVLLHGGIEGVARVSRASLFLFAVRWMWDLFVYALATFAAAHLGRPDHELASSSSPGPVLAWLGTATEALSFVWLKHVATLRGFSWAARRARTWEGSRASPPSESIDVAQPDR